jgi:hypothetical protein
MGAMQPHFERIVKSVEPLVDSVYGPLYRCSLTLKDGTFLPCAVLQSKNKLVELATRRLREETGDAAQRVFKSFVSAGNRVNDYDVADAAPSRFAPPVELLRQIRGETSMGWTGWVFEMKDGSLFPYGSTFLMEFFQLPDGYEFSDVATVHNHSVVSEDGNVSPLRRAGLPRYGARSVLRERPYFVCPLDGL